MPERGVGPVQLRNATQFAFHVWSQYIPVTFHESNTTDADIQIVFYKYQLNKYNSN